MVAKSFVSLIPPLFSFSRFDSLFLCRLYQSFLLQLWKRLKSHDSDVCILFINENYNHN